MKMIKKIFMFFILTTASIGCDDFLVDEDNTKITTVFLYENPEGLKSAVNALYALERDYYTPGNESAAALGLIATSDIAVCVTGTVFNMHSFNNVEPDGWGGGVIGRVWRSWYQVIDRANAVIGAAEVITGMEEEERIQAIAEARVVRGHAYFNLYRWFHNIYINNEATTPDNVFNIEFKLATEEEIYAAIEADLDYGIENLAWTTELIGKYTQGAARHIRSKVAMFKGDWAEAALQSETILTEGPYQLLAEPSDVFDPATDGNHAESIYTHQFNEENVGGGVFHWYANHFQPIYYFVDGMKKSIDVDGRGWGRIYPNDYLFSLYALDNAGNIEDDKRWNDFYTHKFYYNDEENLPVGKNLGDEVVEYDKFGSDSEQLNYYNQIHPYTTKYKDPARGIESLFSWKNIIVYRLAETYLIASEANMRLGDNGKAFMYLDAVRQRAGLTTTPAMVTQDLILEERARELALEGQRWFTLKRMGILITRIQNYMSDPTYYNNIGRDNVQPHNVNWPIPQSELDKMGDFPQNDGY